VAEVALLAERLELLFDNWKQVATVGLEVDQKDESLVRILVEDTVTFRGAEVRVRIPVTPCEWTCRYDACWLNNLHLIKHLNKRIDIQTSKSPRRCQGSRTVANEQHILVVVQPHVGFNAGATPM